MRLVKIPILGLIAAMQRIASASLNVLFAVVCVRLVGADSFGSYLALMAIFGVISTIVALGVPVQLGRELAMEHGGGSRLGIAPLIDISTWIVLGLVLASGLGFIFGKEGFALGFVFVLVRYALEIIFAMFMGADRVVAGSWVTLILLPLFGIPIIYVLHAFGLTASVHIFLAQTLAALITLLISSYLVLRFAKSSSKFLVLPKLKWTNFHSQYLRSGITLALTQTLVGLSTQVDILVISTFGNAVETAHYHAAARAALIVSVFSGMIAAVAAPSLVKQISENDIMAQYKTVRKASLAGFTVTIIAGAIAVIVGPFYLSMFGESFNSAYPTLLVLCAALLIFSASGPCQMVLRAHALDNIVLWVMSASVLINAVLSIFLIKFFGLIGVAWATAVQFIVMGYLMNRACVLRLNIKIGVFQMLFSDFKRR